MQKEHFSDSINPSLNNMVFLNRMLFNNLYWKDRIEVLLATSLRFENTSCNVFESIKLADKAVILFGYFALLVISSAWKFRDSAEKGSNSVLLYLKIIGLNFTGGKDETLSLGTVNRRADRVKKLDSGPLFLRHSKKRTLSQLNNWSLT